MAGFALVEAMVSLLLLALVLLGANRALVAALGQQEATLLQVRAADLASNLGEALRGAGSTIAAEDEILRWREQVPRTLPGALATLQPGPGPLELELQWPEPGSGQSVRLAVAIVAGNDGQSS